MVVNNVLAGADTFVEIEAWAHESLAWFWRYLKLGNGIPSQENGFRNPIQRKGHRNSPLFDCQQLRNKRVAKTRTQVEQVFGVIDQMGCKLLRTIGHARANFAMMMMMMAASYNRKRLVYFRKARIEAL